MKPGRFRVKLPARKPAKQIDYFPRPRAVAVVVEGPARVIVAAPKENPLQDEKYMAAVRTLACAGCGTEGWTVFCHSDEGKGLSIKSDCRLGWPGCTTRPGINGCHHDVGSTGFLGRDGRRAFEAAAAKQTRRLIREAGLWPKDLPAWPEDEDEA